MRPSKASSGGTFSAAVGSTMTFWAGMNSTHYLTGSTTFYNLEFRGRNITYEIAAGSTLTATGILTLTDPNNPFGDIINGGSLNAQGDVVVASSTFQGGTATLLFTGGNTQSYTNTYGGTNLSGTWTVNKTGGQVNLLSDLTINDSGTQKLNVAAGTIYLNNYNLNVSTLTVGTAGDVQLNGNETMTIVSTNIISGSSFTYVGTMSTQTIKNFAYSNLTINGGASTEFNFPANLTTINNLKTTQQTNKR
jgi:hypothetical protein